MTTTRNMTQTNAAGGTLSGGETHDTVSINTAIGTTETLDFRKYTGGCFCVPEGSSLTTLAYWVATKDEDASYEQFYGADNSAVTQTVAANRSYVFPDALAGAAFVRIVGNAAGSLTGVYLKKK